MAARTPDCDDRQYHNYRGQCSPDRTPCHCRHARGGRPLVCDRCHQRTQRDLQLHTVGVKFDNIGTRAARTPPIAWRGSTNPLPRGRNPPWDGFLTRTCAKCEAHFQAWRNNIETRVWSRSTKFDRFQSTHGRHFNTCTCRFELGIKHNALRECFPHRKTKLKSLERRKKKNDIWLRNTERSDSGKTSQASDETKEKRRTDDAGIAGEHQGTWRACACGRSTTSANFNEVWQCMACEGYWSMVTPANSRHAAALPLPLKNLSEYFPMGRTRHDFTS